MKQEKSYREMLRAAVCLSIATSLEMIAAIIASNLSVQIIFSVAFIALMIITILQWIRGTKKYIDFTIEEKINQKCESASLSNENVSTE